MSFTCQVCCKFFTPPGTNHAVFSTPCGHLIGRSCLDILKKTKRQNIFNCFFCRAEFSEKDCHPIYNIPDKFYIPDIDDCIRRCCDNNYVRNLYLTKNFKQEPLIVTKLNKSFGGHVTQMDYYNGYFLIIATQSPENTECQFLKIFEADTGYHYYSVKLGSIPCTAVCFNKHQKDIVEFAIGFESGEIKKMSCCLSLHKFVVNTETYYERQIIYSLCFFEKDVLAYSVGEGNLMVFNTNKICGKKNWAIFKDDEKGVITNIKKANQQFILGIMCNKIYAFEEDVVSYQFCKGVDGKIGNYEIDPSNNIFYIKYNGEFIVTMAEGESGRRCDSYAFYRAVYRSSLVDKKNRKCKGIHDGTIFKSLLSETKQFSMSFNSLLFEKEAESDFKVYSFIQYIACKILRNVNIFTGENEQPKKLFSNINECMEIYCLEKPKLFLPSVLKIKMLLVFEDNFRVVEFFYPISE